MPDTNFYINLCLIVLLGIAIVSLYRIDCKQAEMMMHPVVIQ